MFKKILGIVCEDSWERPEDFGESSGRFDGMLEKVLGTF